MIKHMIVISKMADDLYKQEDGVTPIYHEVSPAVKFGLRCFGGVAAIILLVALIICFVKGGDDSVMYLLAVNMLISSVVGGIIVWWYHKGIIESRRIVFMVFVGVCIIFQAITSDIYVYNKVAVAATTDNPPTSIVTGVPINITAHT